MWIYESVINVYDDTQFTYLTFDCTTSHCLSIRNGVVSKKDAENKKIKKDEVASIIYLQYPKGPTARNPVVFLLLQKIMIHRTKRFTTMPVVIGFN